MGPPVLRMWAAGYLGTPSRKYECCTEVLAAGIEDPWIYYCHSPVGRLTPRREELRQLAVLLGI